MEGNINDQVLTTKKYTEYNQWSFDANNIKVDTNLIDKGH